VLLAPTTLKAGGVGVIVEVGVDGVDEGDGGVDGVDEGDGGDGGIIKLGGCGHIFHKNCIDKWVESRGKTCPLCRAVLYNCDSCDGSGYKTIYHEGVVPPIEYRGIEPRQHTDGLYGIHDHYLEDLYVAGLKYNNEDRELFVFVQT